MSYSNPKLDELFGRWQSLDDRKGRDVCARLFGLTDGLGICGRDNDQIIKALEQAIKSHRGGPMIPKPYTDWRHTTGELHRVVMSNPREVITWGADKSTWLGTPEQFEKEFRFLPTQ